MPTAREALLDAALTALAVRPWPAVRMVEIAAAAGVSRQTLYNEFGSKEGLARALVVREADAWLHGVETVLRSGTGPGPGVGAEAAAGAGVGIGAVTGAGATGERTAPGVPRPGGGPAGAPDRPAAGSAGAAADTGADRLVAAAEWIVAEARSKPLVRALLTGCWGEPLPEPHPAGPPRAPRVPRPGRGPSGPPVRSVDAGPPAPGRLADAVRDRSLAVLSPGLPGADARSELALHCELAVRLALSYVVAPGSRELGALVRTAMGAPGSGPGGISGPSRTAGDR
ncbi:TetR/AcrR family transcriptional regulator [Streptomyces sp. LP05-1]|uniref:TetR/AcrR family transcriptional regulator n=1 Tax=Streptomyces pyxinae TaxID=2970734 RepID=A0ABT2CAD7_9ACTN|nr:helix-turn-helix domain-containing protein [Streptomyces sp. LP05-1]MCS0634374.1 TetR/AcrR family transcriptional regulator [Streptomyces sp. LP05-1]